MRKNQKKRKRKNRKIRKSASEYTGTESKIDYEIDVERIMNASDMIADELWKKSVRHRNNVHNDNWTEFMYVLY